MFTVRSPVSKLEKQGCHSHPNVLMFFPMFNNLPRSLSLAVYQEEGRMMITDWWNVLSCKDFKRGCNSSEPALFSRPGRSRQNFTSYVDAAIIDETLFSKTLCGNPTGEMPSTVNEAWAHQSTTADTCDLSDANTSQAHSAHTPQRKWSYVCSRSVES